MNELQIFKYENNDVRTVEINGEPWFVLKDVCGVLGVNNSRMVADRLDDDEKGVSQIDTLGGKQSMIVINEPGLYNIILRSAPHHPQARRIHDTGNPAGRHPEPRYHDPAVPAAES